MNAPYSIRQAVIGDVPAVLAIAESSSPWAPQYPVSFYRQVVEAQHDEPLRRRLLVSAGAGGMTGFAVVAVLTTVQPAEAELESLAVAPGARGRGTGEALVQAAIAWAGAGTFRLEVRAQNDAAIRLYRRCGFEDVAVRRGYYSSPADDALCMELRRGMPAAHTAGVALLLEPDMVRDGFFYAAGFLLVAAVLYKLTGSALLAALPVLLALFFLWFFRDPTRAVPADPGALVSPADGKVTEAEWIETPDGSRLRLSIFLNVFDVHVNRAPVAGTVTQVSHKPGMFLNAMRPDSNVLNEQVTMVIDSAQGAVQVKQIAGLLARRIVCNMKPGDRLERGQRYGLIKFGSRVDVLMPSGATLHVKKGDRVKGGSTVLATLHPARTEHSEVLAAAVTEA